ncbi:UNVERIFIED_CONTAM: hypothetical protein Scaly_0028100 [Sesamum calycinum]|uniref:Uncharacterized protein n=1 Tax=Sesamum calycinum TaxID=2727403 RepID=A0AAW2SUF3_9LAMI
MEIPLVYMLPNSTTRALAGNWNNNPGDSRMNRATATTTGPQSGLIFPRKCGVVGSELVVTFLKGQGVEDAKLEGQ